ncbi:hypothetical protein [Helicobacter pylori]|uniref:hypothetical protein n=1 Tax=Helicobacter pylori TaxID=210 RepID=UPI001E3B0CAA|nr:hypothetical protein [Helicobacter pylori]
MRQKNETATSFNQLMEITQIMQVQKRSVQTSDNANTSESARQSALKPKSKERAKNHAIKPTKRAFSKRQITTIRDNSQASVKKSQETQQGDKQANHANAFKSDEAEQRGQE